MALGDETVRRPAGDDRHRRQPPERQRSEDRRLLFREAALPFEVRRQPCQDEEPGVIAAEQNQEGAPRVALGGDLHEPRPSRPREAVGPSSGRGAPRDRQNPWHQPRQRAESQRQEERPPAPPRDNQPADQSPHRRTGFRPGVQQRVGEPPAPLGKVVRDHAGVRRIGNRFACAEHQPQPEQDAKPGGEARKRRRRRPHQEARRIDPVGIVAVHQPAGGDLA